MSKKVVLVQAGSEDENQPVYELDFKDSDDMPDWCQRFNDGKSIGPDSHIVHFIAQNEVLVVSELEDGTEAPVQLLSYYLISDLLKPDNLKVFVDNWPLHPQLLLWNLCEFIAGLADMNPHYQHVDTIYVLVK